MTPTLSDSISVRGRFHRSVQIERDWASGEHLKGYLLTPNARALTARIIDGLYSPHGPRAWSMVGPYGSGKSSFTLFLTDVLASAQAQTEEGLRFQAQIPNGPSQLLPILVVGRRASLREVLHDSLIHAVTEAAPELLPLVEAAAAGDLAATFERVALGVRDAGYGGLLLVLDEFGKFLEHAAADSRHDELFLMQQLAEAAERSPAPMVLLTILHTSFADYLGRDEGVARIEWQKVQGRFSDVRFHEPPEQFLKLIGNALEVDRGLRERYHHAYSADMKHSALHEASRRIPELPQLLERCLPLDPLTALLLWPLFRSKMAQNERSLFGFLTSGEPGGLTEFLRHQDSSDSELPLYRLDGLYDYVTQSLGSAVHQRDLAVRWGVLENACERVPADAPPLTLAVVKAIGLLSSYGTEVGLRASASALALAFGHVEAVEEALEYLKRRSIVVYRSYEESYALWDGSDVDLELEFQRALQKGTAFSAAASVARHADLPPMLARAHYVKTGTLRSFATRAVNGGDATELLHDEATRAPTVTFVLTQDANERTQLIELAQQATRENALQVWAFPSSLAGLERAVEELNTWERVRDEVQALSGDPVARRELEGRLAKAHEQLERLIGRIFGLRGYRFDPMASTWVQGGAIQPDRVPRAWISWLSALCDDAYHEAPTLHNELINRNTLSSQTVKARRNLIEAMLTQSAMPDLGITGHPPERSMYRSVLLEGGFHKKGKGGWRFTAPAKGWAPVWQAMETFLKGTHGGRRPISDLFTLLQDEPYGLKEGPIPVIVTALLLVHRETVALFDEGLFVPDLRIEVLERLMRRPELFEIQQFKFEPKHVKTLHQAREALAQLQGQMPEGGQTVGGLLEVVKPLILVVAHLPPFTRQTRQLQPPYAATLRELLTRATDPSDLIFEQLTALHAETAAEGQDLSHWLLEGLQGLNNAYPLLLDTIEAQMRKWLHLTGTSAEVREQLRTRAQPLVSYSADPNLAAMIRQAAAGSAQEWREAMGRVIGGGKPPRDWRDADVAQFPLRLERLALEFHRLEELVAAKGEGADTFALRIDTLDAKMQSDLMVLTLTEVQRSEAQSLSKELLQVIENASDQDSQVLLASIVDLARTLLKRQHHE